MKPKPSRTQAKHQRRFAEATLLAAISESRILQLSNDMSEGIKSGTTKEWRAVAYYFRFKMDKLQARTSTLHSTLAALNLSEQMRAMAMKEVSEWVQAANGKLTATFPPNVEVSEGGTGDSRIETALRCTDGFDDVK